jgi:hypothetical protein
MLLKSNNLPIWRDSQRLLLLVEQTVQGFTRYHKYTLGTQLREQAMWICRILQRALNAQGKRRLNLVLKLQVVVDELKLLIQLSQELKIFRHFSQFQQLAELTVQVGK